MKRAILKALFRFHHEKGGQGSMGADELMRAVGADDEARFYEALQFLHDEDYVEGTPVPFTRAGYLKGAGISKKGIDIVDDPSELERLFPSGPGRSAAEEFIEDVRHEIKRTDAASEEKEALLVSLRLLTDNPRMLDILSAILSKRAPK